MWETAAATEHSTQTHIPKPGRETAAATEHSTQSARASRRHLAEDVTATEHSEESASAAERHGLEVLMAMSCFAMPPREPALQCSSPRDATEHGDPPIRLSKATRDCKQNMNRPGAHHTRTPDIALSISVFIPSSHATERAADIEYSGEYVGHGQSKTAFELHCRGERFDGAILKVAKKNDMEPGVFMQTYQYGLAPPILYNATGFHDRDRYYHSWITEATIPLDEVARYNDTEKSKCTLAAFCCILRALKHNFFVSDVYFFNFGLRITNDATEHKVVIIDAGSRGIQAEYSTWAKSVINTKCIKQFWQYAHAEGAGNAELEDVWKSRYSNDWKKCLAWAEEKWQQRPLLTTFPVTSEVMRQHIRARERDEIQQSEQTSQQQP